MDVFDALADETRRRLLLQLSDGAHTAGDLARTETISRPAISRHLKVLREAGVLDVQQNGRQRFYALRAQGLEPVRDLVERIASPPEPAPPVSEHHLDALELEVRRTVRDRPARQDHRQENSA
ncbi:ArsR/SmtB family transcription factor [Brachybacterium sp. GCM10030267]|uniref:ArsR/SmtB family transcription factor n=1 Tax=unclassified Brachybacterium TaxID=2623841 RepID=UPI0036074DE8